MRYPEYADDLQRIHASEVYGVALFDTAARLTRDAERTRKWLALKALEQQTLARYLTFMRETRQPVREPRFWRQKGQVEGATLGVLPWRVAMTLLRDGTQPFQETFLRLKRHASPEQSAFFEHVYAHEKAIEAFATRELAGESNSLQAVEALLAR